MKRLSAMKRIMKMLGSTWFVALAIAGVLTVAGPGSAGASSAIPTVFNYQGILRLGADNSLANGSFTMTFRLYKSLTPTIGKEVLFTQTISGVVVRDGIFSVVLGDDPNNSIPADAFSSAPLFVGIQVAPDAGRCCPDSDSTPSHGPCKPRHWSRMRLLMDSSLMGARIWWSIPAV